MKKTRKERGWLKKTFKRAMDKELREHKSSFIVFYILRALVIVSLVRQIILDNYEGAFFCILTIAAAVCAKLGAGPAADRAAAAAGNYDPLLHFRGRDLGRGQCFLCQRAPIGTPCSTPSTAFWRRRWAFLMVLLLNDNEKLTFDLSPFFLAMVAFCFSMTIGVLWEFFEFGMDWFFHTDMQRDTVINAIYSASLDPTRTNKVVAVKEIHDVVINGENLGLGGYLDIGLIDTMKDLLVNFVGAVVFSVAGYFYARSKGKKRAAALNFVPSKKNEDHDYLQQARENGPDLPEKRKK